MLFRSVLFNDNARESVPRSGVDDLFGQVAQRELASLLKKKERFAENASLNVCIAETLSFLGDLDGAQRVLEESLKTQPSDTLYHCRGQLFLEHGDVQKAESAFRSCDLSKSLAANLGLAFLKVKQNDLVVAKQFVSTALDIDFADYNARLFAGALCLWDKDYPRAIRSFRIASEERPRSSIPLVHLAAAYFAINQNLKAVKAIRRAVSLNPLDEMAVALYADLLLLVGTPQSALGPLEFLTKFYGESFSDAIWDRLIRSYVDSNKVAAAVKLLLGRYSREPTNASISNNLGVVLLKLGKVDEAKKFLMEAVAKAGKNVSASQGLVPLLNLSTLLLRQEDFRNSELVLRNAIGVNFGDLDLESDIWIRHLEALAGLGRAEESVKQAVDLLNSWRSSPLAFSRIATFLLHQYSTTSKSAEKATALASEVLGGMAKGIGLDARTRRQVANNAVFSLLIFDRIDLAIRFVDLLNPFVNKDPFVTATIGLFNLRRGRLEKGVLLYDQAVGMVGDARLKKRFRQRLNIELGRHFLNRGDFSQAVRALDKAVNEKGGFGYAKTEAELLLDETRGRFRSAGL